MEKGSQRFLDYLSATVCDPANKWGMPEHDEDFGQTLGHYGVGAGPYLVLSVMGPSILRDTSGLIIDTAVRSAVLDWAFDDVNNKSKWGAAIDIFETIDARHSIPFRYYQSGSPAPLFLLHLIIHASFSLQIRDDYVIGFLNLKRGGNSICPTILIG